MKTITYERQEEQDKTVSAFLMMVLEYGQEIGLFLLLKQMVKVQLKEVVYSVLNKAQTVIASLVMGCKHTKASRKPDAVWAGLWWILTSVVWW